MVAGVMDDELIWLDAKDEHKIWYQDKAGVAKSYRITPNKMVLRKCVYDTNKYLVGVAQDQAKDLPREVQAILDQMKNGLTLNESMRLNWCEVLCVGERRAWSKIERKLYKIAKNGFAEYRVGDFVVMPEQSSKGRFWRGLWGKEYMLISETHEPVLLMPKEYVNAN